MARPPVDQPLLSRASILDATLRLLDDKGLEKLSMRGLARELSVSPASLYHWFDSKDALLQAVFSRALEELVLPSASGDSWEDGLRGLCTTYRELWRRHPALTPLLVTGPATTTAELAIRHEMHRLLELAGVPAERRPHALRVLPTFLTGFLIASERGDFGAERVAVERAMLETSGEALDRVDTTLLDADELFETTVSLIRHAVLGLAAS